MTLEEKIGQLNQYNDYSKVTGPVTVDVDKVSQIRKGQVGSLLNCMGADRTRSWQKLAMESRLKIPFWIWSSYTTFKYSDLKLSKKKMKKNSAPHMSPDFAQFFFIFDKI